MAKIPPKCAAFNTEEELDDLINNVSTTKVVLLDCHEEWCGPTTSAMGASYLAIFNEHPKAEERIFLSSICYNPAIKAKLQSLTHDVKFDTQGCRPLFLLLRNGACVGTIDGLNVPNIASSVKLWIPPIAKVEEDQ